MFGKFFYFTTFYSYFFCHVIVMYVHFLSGLFRAAVPSGASTGIYEALELRDNDWSLAILEKVCIFLGFIFLAIKGKQFHFIITKTYKKM